MKSFSKAVKIGQKAAYILLLTSLTGCWASKKETAAYLTKHMKAYENINITPGNAESVVKSTDLLLSKGDDNNFRDALSLAQKMSLNKARNDSRMVIDCIKSVESAKSRQSSGEWKIAKPETMTSTEWSTRLGKLQDIDRCDKKIKALSALQKSQLTAAIREITINQKTMLAKEDAMKLANEVAKQAAKDAERAAEASRNQKWTYDQAMKEACDAGRQYREDVDLYGMKPPQARYEAQEYSKYLAENSPAPRKALFDKIQQGLWMDSCS